MSSGSIIVPLCTDPIDPERLKAYAVRDTLLGHNHKSRSVYNAIALARECTWPDAQWLVELYDREDHKITTAREAYNMFKKYPKDARALAYAGMLMLGDIECLNTAIQMGNAFAQAYPRISYDKNIFESAKQDERSGLAKACIFKNGISCLKRAIALGHVESCRTLARLYTRDDPKYYYLMGKYAELTGITLHFMYQIEKHEQSGPIFYQIGKSVNKTLDDDKTCFGNRVCDNTYFFLYNACDYYSRCCSLTRDLIRIWLIIAKRDMMVKDIRNMIVKLIWESRSLGLY